MATLDLRFDNARSSNGLLSVPLIIRFEPFHVTGVGGHDAPHISIPIAVEPTQPRTVEVEYFPVAMVAELHLGGASVGPLPIDTLLSSAPVALQLGVSPMPMYLPFPTRAMERVEAHRQGRDVTLTLGIRATVVQHTASNGGGVRDMYQTWGIAPLSLPRSHWVDTVLSGMGHDRSYFLEIEAPTSPQIAKPFQKALKELEGASQAFQHDAYDDTFVRCRKAIDAVSSAFKLDLRGEKPSYSVRIEAFRRDHLDPRIGQTKAQLVADELQALWRPLSATAHPGSFTTDRASAKHVLLSTANLVSYLRAIFQE